MLECVDVLVLIDKYIVKAHGQLQTAFRGYGNKTGKAAFTALGLDLPKSRKQKENAE